MVLCIQFCKSFPFIENIKIFGHLKMESRLNKWDGAVGNSVVEFSSKLMDFNHPIAHMIIKSTFYGKRCIDKKIC